MGADTVYGRRAVFLDRDGVINRNVLNPATGELEAPLTAAEFEVLPGVSKGLRQLQAAGYLLFVVSNQPNYAKGKSTLRELRAVDGAMRDALDAMRVWMAAVYYCLHHPEGGVQGYTGPCACRKPAPYFLFKAAREYGIDLSQSWMVGDRATDVACGRAAGVRTILVGESAENLKADWVGRDLAEAARHILDEMLAPQLSVGSAQGSVGMATHK
ncbi:MAG TPA: HAD-IIIA family hydrolase [Acidobacteriaceae bacterium]|nr:HAD-IIIA family hydrolase [Acidobacteriaceae bacterium]